MIRTVEREEVRRILIKPIADLDAEDLRRLALEDREHGECDCTDHTLVHMILVGKFGLGFRHDRAIATCEAWINEEPDQDQLSEQEDPAGFDPHTALEHIMGDNA